jgi:hypothetical protein
MPKVRGDEVDEALEELEEEKWDCDSGEWLGPWYHNVAADYVADDKGNVRALHGRITIDEEEFPCDTVDPIIWPMLTKLLRRLPKDNTKDEDDIPPFV